MSMDVFCESVNNLRKGLTSSDEKVQELKSKKSLLEHRLKRSSSELEELQTEVAKLNGEQLKWEQREKEINQDISRLSRLLQESKDAQVDDAQVNDGCDQQINFTISSFEQNCHDIVTRMRTFYPWNDETDLEKMNREIRELEDKIAALKRKEEELLQLQTCQLPFQEIKLLLDMVTKK